MSTYPDKRLAFLIQKMRYPRWWGSQDGAAICPKGENTNHWVVLILILEGGPKLGLKLQLCRDWLQLLSSWWTEWAVGGQVTSPLGRRKKERLRHRQAGLYAHHASCVDFLYQFPECHGTSRKVVRRVWEDTAEPGAVFSPWVPSSWFLL